MSHINGTGKGTRTPNRLPRQRPSWLHHACNLMTIEEDELDEEVVLVAKPERTDTDDDQGDEQPGAAPAEAPAPEPNALTRGDIPNWAVSVDEFVRHIVAKRITERGLKRQSIGNMQILLAQLGFWRRTPLTVGLPRGATPVMHGGCKYVVFSASAYAKFFRWDRFDVYTAIRALEKCGLVASVSVAPTGEVKPHSFLTTNQTDEGSIYVRGVGLAADITAFVDGLKGRKSPNQLKAERKAAYEAAKAKLPKQDEDGDDQDDDNDHD